MTQAEALTILKTGRSAFITGAAGAGKTYVLREYIKWLEEHHIPVAITASTGIASTHMGGITIHAWSGIGIKDYLNEDDIDALCERRYLRERIFETQVLIIDEISMLHDFRIDLIDRVVRRVKGVDLPFGGMQVIFSGDFFQLPPITRRNNDADSQLFEEEKTSFAYHSRSWKDLDLAICYIHEQHRQADDMLLDVLNAMRDRRVDRDIKALLHERMVEHSDVVGTTKLYAKNINVDVENERELNKIDTNFVEYIMTERGNPNLCLMLKKSCLAPEILRLKVGAQVMFVKNNFDKEFVNGTQGEVVFLSTSEIHVKKRNGDIVIVPQESWSIDEDGKKKAEIMQYPLRLAWAITVHKSQGMSLDRAVMDLSDVFEPGMGYVALSRLRTLDGVHLLGISEQAYIMHDEVVYFDEQFKIQSEDMAREISSLKEDEISRAHTDFIARTSNKKEKIVKKPTTQITRELFEAGMTVQEIAKERDVTIGTIVDHLEKLKEEDPSFYLKRLMKDLGATKYKTIAMAFHKLGTQDGGQRPLKPVFELLKGKYDYETIRLVRLCL
ncbi:MAG: helix-turn-helix domain-containing protein [bacterium]